LVFPVVPLTFSPFAARFALPVDSITARKFNVYAMGNEQCPHPRSRGLDR
jgi:alpha-D-ribose 1-methylphosphonate 5-triphosphate synthase subunit PhnH